MSKQTRVLVTGAGGFIGHHLVSYLKERGYWVRGADMKEPEYAPSDADEFELLDLRDRASCVAATRGVDEVYAMAADMGGMGYISKHDARILHDNALININTIEAARKNGAQRYLYTSSACVYPEYLQEETDVTPLREEDAYPAQPQDAYGWEKLVSELLCQYYTQDYGLETRIVRFHNIFGPLGTWDGGREKVPAALCRKIAYAKLTDSPEIEIWGDGEQTRSFCYVDDCVTGLYKLMRSDYGEPLNLGQDRMVSINELAGSDRQDRRAARSSRKGTSTAHRVSGVGTRTTRACARFSAGSPRSRWRRGSRERTPGSRTRSAADSPSS